MVMDSTARIRFTLVVDSTNRNTIANKRPACNVSASCNTVVKSTQITHILYKSDADGLVGNFILCRDAFIAGQEDGHQKVGYNVPKKGEPEVQLTRYGGRIAS